MEKVYISDIVEATKGEIIHGSPSSKYILSVATDSREKLDKGLFIAIEGENTDGHLYIENAVKNGAICVFVTKDVKEYIDDVIYIKVEDSVKALKDLATVYRNRFNIPIIAVTGSVGKTTTKDMIYCVLARKYNTLKTKGNLNSNIGAPMTVLNLNNSHEIAVIEMGMDHLRQIASISSIVKPETAVITNIGVAHIEFLKTRENILKAKCEVFENLKDGGTAILNKDDDMLITIDNSFDKIWYGIDNNADVRAENIVIDYTKGLVKADITVFEKKYLLKIRGLSKHLVYSALASVAVGIKYNIDMEEIIKGIEDYEPGKMRINIHNLKDNILLIDDTYNANPHSMKSLIDTLSNANVNNKILILGDMFELGEKSTMLHKEVIEYCLEKGIDNLVLIGENMYNALKSIGSNSFIKYYKTKEDLYDELNDIVKPDSIIGVKASRGMKFENITEKILEIKQNM